MVHTGLRGVRFATPDPKLDQLLRTAIEQTRLLRLRYRNRDRIVEPHDYGVHNGVIKLLTWQIAGSSSSPLPNWRWMETDLISDAQLLDQTFPADARRHPASITNGTSCSSGSSLPVRTRNNPGFAQFPPPLRSVAENSPPECASGQEQQGHQFRVVLNLPLRLGFGRRYRLGEVTTYLEDSSLFSAQYLRILAACCFRWAGFRAFRLVCFRLRQGLSP